MLSREELLQATDLIEREVDLPSIKGKVRVRSLPAAYSNEARSEALEMMTSPRGEQTARVNTKKLEALQVLHALVEPKLQSIEDAYTFAQRCGPAWHEVVKVIDEISGIDKETIEKTNAQFQGGGEDEGRSSERNGVASGDSRSDLPVRTGA